MAFSGHSHARLVITITCLFVLCFLFGTEEPWHGRSHCTAHEAPGTSTWSREAASLLAEPFSLCLSFPNEFLFHPQEKHRTIQRQSCQGGNRVSSNEPPTGSCSNGGEGMQQLGPMRTPSSSCRGPGLCL